MNEDSNQSTNSVMCEPSSPIESDEIDLIALVRTIIRGWKIIAFITILSVGLAYLYAKQAPEIFRSEILLSPVGGEKGSVSSAIGQLGGLASMVGAQIPRDSNIDRVLATLKSRKFLGHYIKSQNLMPVLFHQYWEDDKKAWTIDPPPSEQSAISTLKANLSLNQDTKSGLVTLLVSWGNPEFATKVANEVVEQLNSQLRDQAIADSKKRIGYLEQELAKTTLQDMRSVLYNLLESEKQKAMLANVTDDFALEVIDPAVLPTTPYKPNRKLIVILGIFSGGIVGVFGVFVLNFWQKLKAT